jgi:hypothetical protein
MNSKHEPTDQDEARTRRAEEAGIEFPMAMLDAEPTYVKWPTGVFQTAEEKARTFSIAVVGASGNTHQVVASLKRPMGVFEMSALHTRSSIAAMVSDLTGLDPDDCVDFIEYAALGVGETTIEIGRAKFEAAGLPMRIAIRRIS